MAVRILVVDDDRAVRESLRRSLSFNGYSVELAQDGVEALEAISADRPDALVLDVMMPRLDGLEVCRHLRSTGDDLPILVLTARDSVSERVAGLDAGADDYLPKPFALEELLARMRALLRRRVTPDEPAESRALAFSDLSLDPVTREVSRGDRQISLTRTEFSLLEMLIANPGGCSPAAASWKRCGDSTSRPRAMRWRCTSAIYVARPRQRASRGSSTPCAGWGMCCVKHRPDAVVREVVQEAGEAVAAVR